jgi:HAMP domain-containing protein
MRSTLQSNQSVIRLLERVENDTTRLAAAKTLASAMHLEPDGVYRFLSQGHGAQTKPLEHHQAELLAKQFMKLGIRVEITPETTGTTFQSKPIPKSHVSSEAPSEAPSVTKSLEPSTDRQPTVQQPTGRRFGLTAKIIGTAVLPLVLVGAGLVTYLQNVLPHSYENVVRQAGHATVEMLVGTLGPNPSSTDLMTLPRFTGSPISFADLRIEGDGHAMFLNDGGDGRFVIASYKAIGKNWNQSISKTIQSEARAPLSYYTVGAEVYRTSKGLVPVFYDDTLTGTSTGTSTRFPATQKAYSLVVGLNADNTRSTIRSQVLTSLGFMLLGVASVTLFAWLLARRLVLPIVGLVQTADRLSLGDLDHPISAGSKDELGDLAMALERIRVSLKLLRERYKRQRR